MPPRTVSRYLFTAFTNDSERALYVYGSDDGRDFWPIQEDAYTPPSGLVRDPSVIRYRDRYWIAYTTGWTGRTFGIAVSEDRYGWTHVADIDHGVAAHNTWAPEFFTDHPDGRPRVIVSLATGDAPGRHFQPCVLTALDDELKHWSAPVALAGIHPDADVPSGYIDTFLLREDGLYHAFTKNASAESVEHAVAPEVAGPYTFTGRGDWAGWGTTPLEGQALFRLSDGSFRIFLDGYTTGTYYYSDSRDLRTWTPKRELPGLSGTVRHGAVWQESAEVSPEDTNPVLAGYHADPDLLYARGRYWMYPTTDGHPGWSSSRFTVFSSPDLVAWTEHGTVLDLADVSWCQGRAWAPAIVEREGTFWLYFSADQQIGVARSDRPEGPFTDALGAPLVARDQYGHQSIDPDIFLDDDGTAYLYFGQGRCQAVRLNQDMVTFDGEPADITPDGYNEAPVVFRRDGRYYLMWSENDTRSPGYQVAYGVSDHPLGPFTRLTDQPVLSQDPAQRIHGTGHHTVVRAPGTDDWYVAYHRFARPGGDGTHREVAIDRMHFTADGAIRPIRPTQRGISPVPPSHR